MQSLLQSLVMNTVLSGIVRQRAHNYTQDQSNPVLTKAQQFEEGLGVAYEEAHNCD